MKDAVVQLSSAAPPVRVLDRPGLVKAACPRTGRAAPGAVLAAPGAVLAARDAVLAVRPGRAGGAGLLVLLCLAVSACRSGDVSEQQPAPVVPPAGNTAGATAAGGAVARTTNKADDGYRPRASEPWHIPVGPKLAITPGKGFGPIRFGAHLDTIERLMGEPCEEKREEAGKLTCRYSAQAVDFVLENGAVTEMRAHRLGRPFKASGKPDYGIFNGSFENGVAFGMVPTAARELLGAPKKVNPVSGDNPFHTVEVHEYDGYRIEFDRLGPDRIVLGGVVLHAGASPAGPSPAQPSPAQPSPARPSPAQPATTAG
jgi:hypothetical protein